MSIGHHEYFNNVSVILGIIVLLLCLFADIPPPHNNLWLFAMPILLITNYLSLYWISDRKKQSIVN